MADTPIIPSGGGQPYHYAVEPPVNRPQVSAAEALLLVKALLLKARGEVTLTPGEVAAVLGGTVMVEPGPEPNTSVVRLALPPYSAVSSGPEC